MARVLIIGATGYLGRRVADALVRSGQHTVFGIARSEAKAKSLALAEVTPILCADPINEPTAYLNAIRDHHIDTIVDISEATPSSSKLLSDIKKIGEERLASYGSAGVRSGPKLGFVYCSGMWVHGSSDKPVTDLDIVGPNAVTPPVEITTWRPDIENSILATSDVLDVAVLRPGLVYGRENTIWTAFILPLLQAAKSGSTDPVRIPLIASAKPGLIHVDDVATAFEKVIQKLPLINNGSVYPVFDLVTSQESMSAIFAALASAWGFKGQYELVDPGDNLFAKAMSTTLRGSSARAKQLLGWTPTRLNGFVADMDLNAAAFASQH